MRESRPEESDESVDRSGERGWEVHADYEVVHGALRPVGDVRHGYSPLVHPEIVTEIAKLHEGDESRVVAFARTWGLLGYPRDLAEGDPLPWVWAHARGIRMVLDLHFYLQSGDYEGLSRFLDSYPRRSLPSEPAEAAILLSTGGPSGILEQRLPWVVIAPSEMAREAIAAIINPNLRELHYELHTGTEGEGLRRVLAFRSPIALAYWHLAEMSTGDSPLVRCKECGAVFVRTDKRQRFCPPPPGWAGKTGSICGARSRKRRQRQRKGG